MADLILCEIIVSGYGLLSLSLIIATFLHET